MNPQAHSCYSNQIKSNLFPSNYKVAFAVKPALSMFTLYQYWNIHNYFIVVIF